MDDTKNCKLGKACPTTSNESNNASTPKTSPENTNQSFNSRTWYNKLGSAGRQGGEYQVGILTIFLLKSLGKIKDWKLSTENKEAGNLEDVVFQIHGDIDSNKDILVQCKHKEKKDKTKITRASLLTDNLNNDFSLIKYIKSYPDIRTKFNIKNLIICTNTSMNKDAMNLLNEGPIDCESMLFYGNDDKCRIYTFKEEKMEDLKNVIEEYNKNVRNKKYKNKELKEINISDDELKEFLNYLQIYCNYPRGNNVDKVVEELLSLSTNTTCIYGQISAPEIKSKVDNWFQHKDGVYLSETYGKALICEIWRDRLWHTLEEYHVQFQNNDFNFPQEKRILHVNVPNGYLLQELKICSSLKDRKEKVLLMSSDDKLEEQKQILDSFIWPDYKFLIVICPKITENCILKDNGSRLKDILEKYKYKQVIVVTEETELLQYLCLNSIDCTVRKDSVRFEDFSDGTQDRLLRRRNILYQGEECSLEDFLPKEDIEKVLSCYVLERLITNKSIDVGVKPRDLDEDVSRFYIERKFEKKFDDGRVQTLSEEALYDEGDKVILISNQAGMGKTAVLTKLAVRMKCKYSDKWVIRIELSNYTEILRVVLDKKREEIDILELMNSKDATKLRNPLEEDVFKLGGRVVLMLDGLDEISPDFTDLVINMLIKCQRGDNFEKIFVTTRPHMTRDLEARLNVKAFNLCPFTETDEKNFLIQYYSYKLELDKSLKTDRCEQYVDALLERTHYWRIAWRDRENRFTAIPLLLRMLAEIFQESDTTEEIHWQGCREYVAGTGTVPELSEEMDIVKLYEMFIEKKQIVFNKKKTVKVFRFSVDP